MSEAFSLNHSGIAPNSKADLSFAQISLDSECSVFSLQGPDAERYLHARTTQDIKTLGELECKKALLLNAQGKIFAAFWILRKSKDSFHLITHGKADETFLEELLRFKVADRFECSQLTPDAILLLSDAQRPQLEEIFSAIPDSSETFFEDPNSQSLLLPLRLRLSNGLNYLVVSTTQDLTKKLQTNSSATIELFHLLRIHSMLPWMKHDLSSKTSATEIAYNEYISFTKGCYTGQEVVEMSTARGRPNYRLIQVFGKQDTAPTSGSALSDPTSGKEIGFITRGVFNAATKEFASLAFVKTNAEVRDQLLLNEAPLSVKEDD